MCARGPPCKRSTCHRSGQQRCGKERPCANSYPVQIPNPGKSRPMEERNNSTALGLFAAGTVAGLTLTYLARVARARMRKPITQAATVKAERARVEEFVETQERMLEALQSRRLLSNIDRLEVRDAPADRGTEIHLTMRGVGKYAIRDVLRRAKAMLETGEIPTGRRTA